MFRQISAVDDAIEPEPADNITMSLSFGGINIQIANKGIPMIRSMTVGLGTNNLSLRPSDGWNDEQFEEIAPWNRCSRCQKAADEIGDILYKGENE